MFSGLVVGARPNTLGVPETVVNRNSVAFIYDQFLVTGYNVVENTSDEATHEHGRGQ